jgi:hypothetical protein
MSIRFVTHTSRPAHFASANGIKPTHSTASPPRLQTRKIAWQGLLSQYNVQKRKDSEWSDASQSTTAPPLRNCDGRGCPDFLSGTTAPAPGGLVGANKPQGSSMENKFVEPVYVGSTHAGELKYGRQVAVSSQVTTMPTNIPQSLPSFACCPKT